MRPPIAEVIATSCRDGVPADLQYSSYSSHTVKIQSHPIFLFHKKSLKNYLSRHYFPNVFGNYSLLAKEYNLYLSLAREGFAYH